MSNMEDRLTKLLIDSVQKNLNVHYEDNGRISLLNLKDVAKDLLDNGALLSPCKVGDTVYQVYADDCGNDGCMGTCEFCESATWKIAEIQFDPFKDFDKSVFLTPEEAERALREKENG